MYKVMARNLFIWIPRLAFLMMVLVFFKEYLNYIEHIISFPYDWEPTDGDHLNFAHRFAQGLPIYLPMENGQVLSIYNPLYHGLIGLLGGEQAGLSFARTLSFLFWLLVPLMVLWFFRKRWGYVYAIIAALLIWLPAEPWMLVDIVQVSPNSTMAFFFLATLLYAEYCVENQSTHWWEWTLLGIIAALCFLAKQQGLIATVITVSFFLVKRVDLRNFLFAIYGFIFVFIVSTVYLEIVNSGEYLSSTLFDLQRIMISSHDLAKNRLEKFLLNSNFSFLVCVLISFISVWLSGRNFKKITIWQISFIFHLPFLLMILGNGGGGPTYFLSMWITMVLISIDIIRKIEINELELSGRVVPIFFIGVIIVQSTISSEINILNSILMFCYGLLAVIAMLGNSTDRITRFKSYVFRDIQISITSKTTRMIMANVLLFSLFINIQTGLITIRRDFQSISLPTASLEKMMENHYKAVAALVEVKMPVKILTYRNIGALVSSNLNIENEGATMFNYAWNSPTIFNRDLVLKDIQEKQFDFITTGLQEYPKHIQKVIDTYYQIELTSEVNLYFGNIGLAHIYVPK